MKVAAKKELQGRKSGRGRWKRGREMMEQELPMELQMERLLGHKLATFPRVGLLNLCGATS